MRPDQPTTGYLCWYKCTLEWTFGNELTKLTPQPTSSHSVFQPNLLEQRERKDKEKTKTNNMTGWNENCL